ncbi:uncharacterized protein LOC129915634 [Episyrphus balteatus]|uniref:uncharacterized protein LOC129915634 n=1 Tax=Episyrphus balteatus TaxID=286459 RepID=UPI002485E2BA|nr:uncharacterized protein LOC129915634 [Episyrphus balteatus]XP_055851254.1 uncharacterized protein LOC129915634 [Episyrphus balteatus]XP_055851263.1 uncharacterized protein LOC129915634 [Episyrphus balteatus]XP_055851272.1 uncharacterized protein LOC129915634 [Episyrphus balteatus]XP_055851279.1 uncharacterized protein LOC129915634 [Episyrphus balteatus]
MYKGSIELSLQTVKTFLRTASFLKMKSLIHGCSEFMEKNMNCNKSLKRHILLEETRMKQKAKLDYKPDKFGIICMKDGIYNIKSWNPEENSWSSLIVTQVKNEIDCDFRIVIGNMLITTGEDMNAEFRKDNVTCFDLDTAKWIHIPPMNKNKLIDNIHDLGGRLFVFGYEELRTEANDIQQDYDNFIRLIEQYSFPRTSTDNNSRFKTSIEMFNFSTRTWIDLQPPCPEIVGCAYSTTSQNGMFYCIGLEINILHTFNVVSNEWTRKKIVRFPNIRRHYRLSDYGFVATEQYLYIIGGEYISNTNSHGIDDISSSGLYRYDLINNCWNEMAHLPTPKWIISSIVHKNKIIICPKNEGDNEVDEVLEYDIETNKWNTLGPLPFPMENNYYSLTHLK